MARRLHQRNGPIMRPLFTLHRQPRRPDWPRSSCGGSGRSSGDPIPKVAGLLSAMKAIRLSGEGSVVVITEGARDVAFFLVEELTGDGQ